MTVIPTLPSDQFNLLRQVIIPMREYEASASSRIHYGKRPGGFWNATTVDEQVHFYKEILADYLLVVVQHDIPALFLDFERMIRDPHYVYTTLETFVTEKQLSFDDFCVLYEKASATSRPGVGAPVIEKK